jgi:hypothetical protein
MGAALKQSLMVPLTWLHYVVDGRHSLEGISIMNYVTDFEFCGKAGCRSSVKRPLLFSTSAKLAHPFLTSSTFPLLCGSVATSLLAMS